MLNCKHEQFRGDVAVIRLKESEDSEDLIGYSAEVKISCAICGQPFEFIGLPAGLHPDHPTVDPAGLELRAPIQPASKFENEDTNKIVLN